MPSRFRSRSPPPQPPTNKAACYLMHTNDRVHELVRSQHRANRRSTTAKSQELGRRYCPSLEDKVMRFPDRERHQLFLEPEGLDVEEIYVNGFSMSLPAETQRELIHVAARPRIRGDAAAWLRGRIRLRPADGAALDARNPPASRPVFRRPDQRHVRLRGGGGPGTCRRPQRGALCSAARRRSCSAATRPISASWSTTWSRKAASSRTECSRRAPSIDCSCAPTTPTCG